MSVKYARGLYRARYSKKSPLVLLFVYDITIYFPVPLKILNNLQGDCHNT